MYANTSAFSSFSAFNLVQKAYYNEAKMLFRNIKESIENIEYLSNYPSELENLLNGKIAPFDKIRLLRIKGVKIASEEASEIYDYLSAFVHPSKEPLTSLIQIDFNNPAIGLSVFPLFNEEEFICGAMFAIFFNCMLLSTLERLFRNPLKNLHIKMKVKKRHNELLTELEKHDYVSLNNLFQLLKTTASSQY
jgi:hypothetical protein